MHEKLIQRLRDTSKICEAMSIFFPQADGNAMSDMLKEAADVIEMYDTNNVDEQISKMQKENQRLTEKVEALQKQIRNSKSSKSWDEEIRLGQVQGMW